MKNGPLRPAVFFDRDGVVNRPPGAGTRYVLNWEAFEFNPGFFDLFRWVKNRGWLAILVTSQKGVGKGRMTLADLDDIHSRMQQALKHETGASFDAIHAHTGLPDCRHPPKPDPGMILTAAQDQGIDLGRSWLIGDADRDIAMAHAAGVTRTIRVRNPENPIRVPAEATLDDPAEALAYLQRQV